MKKNNLDFDFIHRTIECTKAALGLRLFMVLAALGEKGLAQYIEQLIELTALRLMTISIHCLTLVVL